MIAKEMLTEYGKISWLQEASLALANSYQSFRRKIVNRSEECLPAFVFVAKPLGIGHRYCKRRNA